MSFVNSSGFSAAVGAAGDVVSAIGTISQGEQAKEAYYNNALISEQQAQTTRKSGELSEYQKRKAYASTMSEQTAAYAASGVTGRGSPLDVMVQSLTNANFDIAIDNYNTEVAARGLEQEAMMRRYEGTQVAREKKTQGATSLIQTGLGSLYKFTSGKQDKIPVTKQKSTKVSTSLPTASKYQSIRGSVD